MFSQQSTFKTIDRWIESHTRDIVDLTIRLVSIDTTVPPGRNYARISKLIVDELKDLGPKPAVSNIPPSVLKRRVSPEVGLAGPRPNTYTTIKGETGGPKILLNGHVDVVPAQPEGWSSDPFKPVLKNGMIFGRGAADMKGSDASIIFSLKALVESGVKFRGSITPTFTTDEEVGGYTGVNHLIDRQVITRDIDYCLSTDSGIDALYVASLGDAEFLITVHGKPAHSGRGWTGVNAIEYGAVLIERLKKLGEAIAKRRSKIDADPGYGTKKMRPGLYITMVKGGLKGNIIPDKCEILVDRRSIPEESARQVRTEVGRIVKHFAAENPTIKVEMKPILGYEPMRTDPNSPLVRVLQGSATKVLGSTVRPVGSQGSTDIAAVSALGIPVAVLGATRKDSNIHGIDEHVRVKDLVSVTKILAHTYLELSRTGHRSGRA